MHMHLYVHCSFLSSSRLLVYRLGNTIGCRLARAYLSVINDELLSVRIMLPIDIKNLNHWFLSVLAYTIKLHVWPKMLGG